MNKYFNDKNAITYCPYLMAGWPSESEFFKILDVLVGSGAKIIEIGIPFSDPSADGPVLTIINHKMSENHKTFEYYLGIIAKAKIQYPNIGICVMCYLNPILQYGIDKFFEFLSKNKIDSFLIPDLPFEEYEMIQNKIPNDIKNIMVVSDNLSDVSIKKISKATSGYLYVLSSISITGTIKNYQEKLKEFIIKLKSIVGNDKKLVVGFGIKSKDDIQFLTKIQVDGFIIGTKIVEEYEKGGIQGVQKFHKAIKNA